MSPDEIDSWIQSQLSNAEGATLLETFFSENPLLREESIANLDAFKDNSRTLLEREDSPGQNTFLLSLCWASLQSAMALIDTEEGRLG